MSGALRPVGSVDDLFRLDPIERFQALITGPNFPDWLRAEPVCFDRDDPIFGYGCSIEDCGQHRTQAGLWCTGHASERLSARHRGIGDTAWKAAAVPFPARPAFAVRPDGDHAAVVAGHHLGLPGRPARRPDPSTDGRPRRLGPLIINSMGTAPITLRHM